MVYFHRLAATLQALDPAQLDALSAFVKAAMARGGTIWLCGNGGSAATAQHWACDLAKAAGVRAQALGSNPALLTALANDESYISALAVELEYVARSEQDSLICLSCSGDSQNITGVLMQAWDMRMPIALVTSMLYRFEASVADVLVTVPSDNYGIIEDCHMAIGHWLTEQLRDGRRNLLSHPADASPDLAAAI